MPVACACGNPSCRILSRTDLRAWQSGQVWEIKYRAALGRMTDEALKAEAFKHDEDTARAELARREALER